MNSKVKKYIENYVDMLEQGNLKDFLIDAVWALDDTDTQDLYQVLLAADVPNISEAVDKLLYKTCRDEIRELDGEVLFNVYARYLTFFKSYEECKEVLRRAVEDSGKWDVRVLKDGKEHIVPIY